MQQGLNRIRRSVSRRVRVVTQRLQEFSSHHKFLAPWYYTLASRSFRREQHAVMSGIRHYLDDVQDSGGNSVLLRRNIHRLEKGLLMRPRRNLFGLSYLAETVETYEKFVSSGANSNEEVLKLWAHDVLKAYFDSTPSHELVDPLRDRFHAMSPPISTDNLCRVPYRRNLDDAPPVTYDSLLQLAKRRRSVRWFLQKPVPRNLIEQAIEVTTQAPSACNRQPFVFRIFDDPPLVDRVISIPKGATGYGQNVPAVAVIVGQQRNFFDERDRHVIYVDGALAAMSFAFALESLGLASCLINWPDIEELEAEMAATISLEPDERPVMLIGFGYPDSDGLVAASAKKETAEILKFNFE